jgi:hypothetical protein
VLRADPHRSTTPEHDDGSPRSSDSGTPEICADYVLGRRVTTTPCRPSCSLFATLGSVIEREPLGGAGQLKQAPNGTWPLPEGELMAVLACALVRLHERAQAA